MLSLRAESTIVNVALPPPALPRPDFMGFLCPVFTNRTPGRYLGPLGSRMMERHRPSAARTRVRSLRPPRGPVTALATVLALLVLPRAAAGASEPSPAPAPPSVESVLSAAKAQLDSLRAQIVEDGYDWILYRLATCAAPEVTAGAINASMWCRGCAGGAYVTRLIPRIEAEYELYARL
jgi:hypothetical protein